jgi:hypothetical protein
MPWPQWLCLRCSGFPETSCDGYAHTLLSMRTCLRDERAFNLMSPRQLVIPRRIVLCVAPHTQRTKVCTMVELASLGVSCILASYISSSCADPIQSTFEVANPVNTTVLQVTPELCKPELIHGCACRTHSTCDYVECSALPNPACRLSSLACPPRRVRVIQQQNQTQ